jgi:uncharacterized phosphosugar-binding protein
MTDPGLEGAKGYMGAVRAIQDKVAQTQGEAISRAAEAVVRTLRADGMIYIFGTGHSHMMAEEGQFRAGGLAAVCPILAAGLMLHESAVASGKLERLVGVGRVVLNRYQLAPKDVLIVFSNSGVNAAPVEVAMEAKGKGLTVIAVVSQRYAAQAPLSALGKSLAEVADIVIDNGLPPGDALVEMGTNGMRIGPGSTVVGAFIMNALLVEAAWRLAAAGEPIPAYISANMPDAGEHNARLLEHYRPRNPHL